MSDASTSSNQRVRLLIDIYDHGADHHPPGYIARKGEVLVVRTVRSLGVSHEGVENRQFAVREGEFELIPPVETSAPNAQLLKRDGFTSLLRDSRDAVKRDAKSDCVCGNFSDPDPECKYCRPGRALLARIDAALERLLVEPAEQPSATFLLARLGTILNIAEGELTAKAQQDIARLAREVVRSATGLCTACGHGDRYHFDDGKGNVVCRWSLDCHCVHRVESIRPEEPTPCSPCAQWDEDGLCVTCGASMSEEKACDHPRSELLARKDNKFEMRKCLECTNIFRVRLSENGKPEHE